MRIPEYLQIGLVTLVAAVIGCGAAQKTSSIEPEVKQSSHPPASFEGIRIGSPIAVEPRSLEAAAVIKARGDAVFASTGLIYRGASAGLLIGEIKGNEFFERSILYLPGAVSDVVVSGAYAYVACGPTGVVIVDVKRPSSPKALITIDTPGAASRLSLNDNLLIVADGVSGIIVIDVKKPLHPEIRATWQSSAYVRHAIMTGDKIYAAEDRAGVAVLSYDAEPSLAEPSLRLMTRFDTDGQARMLYLDDTRLYVADGPGGLLVLDTAVPIRPRVLGKLELPDMARDVTAIGSRAFVANGDDGLITVDVSDPTKPASMSVFSAEMPINRVRLDGRRLLIGNDSAGLLVIDATKPNELLQIFPAPASNDIGATSSKSVFR